MNQNVNKLRVAGKNKIVYEKTRFVERNLCEINREGIKINRRLLRND